MINSKSAALCIVSIGLIAVLQVQAAPYYYYFHDAPAPAPAHEAVQQAAATTDLGQQAQQMASQAQDSMKGAVQQVADQAGQAGEQLSGRLHGHLSELYAHGSSAVKGVVDTVQPDIKHIGQDLTDVYQKTRTQVGKQMEPLAQTVRPYLDHAQKVVAPYMTQAREEVPKLIGQAKPALTKVGEQVRGSINEVLKKINGNEQPQSASEAVSSAADQAQQQQHQHHQHHHDSASNSVQQVADSMTV